VSECGAWSNRVAGAGEGAPQGCRTTVVVKGAPDGVEGGGLTNVGASGREPPGCVDGAAVGAAGQW
jgi:hypothetical protein